MIGKSSFLLQLTTLIAPIFLFVVGYKEIVLKKQKRGYIVIIFATGLSLLMITQYFHQIHNYIFFRTLDADSVQSIQIGATIISDHEQLVPIINALNESQWFSPNHGGWGDTVTFIITQKDGENFPFQAGYYLRQEGAVIEFLRGSGRGDGSAGYAFCPNLPSVLIDAGILLPSQSLSQ